MGVVLSLKKAEQIQLDQARLLVLDRKLGRDGADTVIGRASRELSARMTRCDRLWEAGDMIGLRKCARSMIAIADQAGMTNLARVAQDVTEAADQRDLVALAATLSRLRRVGESSLRAVWRARGAMV
ncbi:hypothetical protein [Antarcticimicrobium luteum]|uniref:Uncharacterized protein n=1 Tax=Antarcticimicrobium luteum TaxID=2547397 RepID=A0A4R5V502_9RHOB|nr:hypothetical protein [Antarcticimicrobium luteum]TDK46821.1 hypothetical protein E1832_12040 [Antarcticimicrobium luteum]